MVVITELSDEDAVPKPPPNSGGTPKQSPNTTWTPPQPNPNDGGNLSYNYYYPPPPPPQKRGIVKSAWSKATSKLGDLYEQNKELVWLAAAAVGSAVVFSVMAQTDFVLFVINKIKGMLENTLGVPVEVLRPYEFEKKYKPKDEQFSVRKGGTVKLRDTEAGKEYRASVTHVQLLSKENADRVISSFNVYSSIQRSLGCGTPGLVPFACERKVVLVVRATWIDFYMLAEDSHYDLRDFVINGKPSFDVIKTVMLKSFEALSEMHNFSVVHNDLTSPMSLQVVMDVFNRDDVTQNAGWSMGGIRGFAAGLYAQGKKLVFPKEPRVLIGNFLKACVKAQCTLMGREASPEKDVNVLVSEWNKMLVTAAGNSTDERLKTFKDKFTAAFSATFNPQVEEIIKFIKSYT